MSESQRTTSLRRIFNQDIQDNDRFYFNGKAIYPTPKENGQLAMENLFNHLTRKVVDKETRARMLQGIRLLTNIIADDYLTLYKSKKRKASRLAFFDFFSSNEE